MESKDQIEDTATDFVVESVAPGDEEEIEVEDIDAPGTQNMISVTKRFISKTILLIQESNNVNDLLEQTQEAFSHITLFANTIVNHFMINQLKHLASQILQRAEELTKSSENQEIKDTEIYDKIIIQLIDNFKSIHGQSDFKQVNLLFGAALALIYFIKAFVTKKVKPVFTKDLAFVLINISHYLETDEKIFTRVTKEIYDLIKKFRDYNLDQLHQAVIDMNKHSQYTYQAYVSKDKGSDPAIQISISDKFNQLVLNDKEKLNYYYLRYFIPFLNNLDLTTFKNQIYSQMEFMLKRNGSLLGVISKALTYLNSIEFNQEIVLMLTDGLISNELLVNQEYSSDCSQYFKSIASQIKDKEVTKLLIIDYLLKRFQATKTQFNIHQRQNIIKHISAAVESSKKDLIQQDQLQAILTALVDHIFQIKDEPVLKECYEDIQKLFLRSESFSFLNDQLKKQISKATTHLHVSLFVELLASSKNDLNDLLPTLTPQFKTMLAGENFKTVANYQSILALVGYFAFAYSYTQDKSYIQFLAQNDNILSYISTTKGFINTLAYFQKIPSVQDIKYHLKAIEVLILYHHQEQHLHHGDTVLKDTLFEYLLNQNIAFREHIYFDTIQTLCANEKQSEVLSSGLLKALYNKVKQVSQRPLQLTREESPYKSNLNVENQVRLTLEYILRNKQEDLTHDDFFNLLRIICHPYVSPTNNSLVRQNDSLVKIYSKRQPEKQFKRYFELYGKELADHAIRQRTGILSPDPTLRKLSINLAVLLACQDGYDLYLNDIALILNYKPLELIQKLEALFQQEFDRISHYDLMFYSEITKDLLTVFKTVDEKNVQKELGVESIEGNQQDGGSNQEEEKKEESMPDTMIDPAKLAAQMMKQQAAQKKQATAAKKGAKKGAAPAKPQAAPKVQKQTPHQEPAQQQPAMDKETRNKLDRQNLLNYFAEIQRIKASHIDAAYEVVKRVNKNGFHLDATLNVLLAPMINMLNYPTSRFSSTMCFSQLFKNHKTDPLFPVKNELVSCLIAISHGRIYIKHQREFQQIFSHIEANTNLEFYDKGYIQLIMTMGNYVLKDLSVNLSVKEQALSVIESFVQSDKVQDIELVRVTINLMKSSYNSKNLQAYLHQLFKRLRPEYLALILQRLFEYEPTPRMAILRELVEFDEHLFNPIWLAAQFWILQFDDDCNKLARRIWNKYGMTLRTGVLDLSQEKTYKNFFYYLRSKNTNIFDATLKATVSAIEIFQNRFDHIIDDLIEFYNQEMVEIKTESLKSVQDTDSNQSNSDILADSRLNRIAVPDIIKRTAHLVQANSFKKIFEFFITQGCLDKNESVAQASLSAALQIIQTKGSDYSEEILRILEKFINEQKKYSELSKNQAIIMIGSLSQYLDNTSQKKLVGTFEKMLELLNTPSELIRQSICKVIPQLARFFDDKSRKFLDDHLKILRESTDEKLLRGSAYAVAGIIKGLGMQTFKQLNILETVKKDCFTSKHGDPLRKVAGLFLYETFSISHGKVFEMNIVEILPNIMQCISDHKENVRKAAIQANRTIMGKLSSHAIKLVLPIFLKGLQVDNWRSKLASVEALGNMAFCAPRQISAFLPQIVKGIREVLNDTHEKVREAALQAILNVGSFVKCPEIADISEVLVKALSNPASFLKLALKTLLETSFVHAIDAPSLSLLVPILDSGLMMHDNESKHLASKLMGNICNLTQDPEDLLPYIKILMPAIKNSLFDSIPEIRASAAKALGSLSKGLGLENSQEMIAWLDSVLHQHNLQSSERSGAAQGTAEIIAVHGIQYFEMTIDRILQKSCDPDPQIRESFRAVMVFMATCFDKFVNYLPKLLPIMIEGLSDEVEDVRKISMRNVKICIKQFARQAPSQLVNPIMEMMFNQDFKVRQSSSVLMYQLVKELENDVIKSQPKYISVETKFEILSCMFILKYDVIERVAIQAAQIWKNIIDNQLKVLKQMLGVLVKQVFVIIQSEYLELQEMGLNCMRGIVEKFGERVVSETLDILENYLERATQLSHTIGLSKAIFNMVYAAPIKLLTDLRQRFLSLMDSYLSSDNEQIRELAAKTFITVFAKTYEPIFISSILDKSFMKKLHSMIVSKNETEAQLLISTLKRIIKDSPDLKIEDKLIKLCALDVHENPITIAQARILAAVAPKVALHMFKKKFYQTVLNVLMQELTMDKVDDEVRVQEVLNTFSELISQVSENEIVTINETIISDFHFRCKDKGRLGFYVDFIGYYCQHAKVNYEKYAGQYLRNVLILMNDKNDKTVEKVIKSFNGIINGLQKENQFTHIPLIKEVIEEIGVETQTLTSTVPSYERIIYRKKVPTIKLLEKPEGVKTLSTIIQNSITHGSIDVRIDSSICFQYLIDFSKLEAVKVELIKICGALIRVVNDKFPPQLKVQIFTALKLILIKANIFVKPMAPQLQTTFLKAFNDSQATEVVRKVVVECLIVFLKIAPKVDPIVKELTTMLEGDKLDKESKIEVSEILAIIIRQSGKTIQPAMATQIQQTLTNILQQKKLQFNDKCLVNSAVALAFLSAYSADQKQQLELFEGYDNTLDLDVIFGVKYGLLLNGTNLPNRDDYIKKTEQFALEQMKDNTGMEDIDERESEDYKDNEGGRLHGAFEVLGHIGDVFIRRFGTTDSELYTSYYRIINQSGIFAKMNEETSIYKQTYGQIQFYFSSIPVRIVDGKMNAELQQVIKDGMTFINNFYLEFNSKKDAFSAVFNMLNLNYDNFLDINDGSKIQILTKDSAREAVNKEPYVSILSPNLRQLAVELLFI